MNDKTINHQLFYPIVNEYVQKLKQYSYHEIPKTFFENDGFKKFIVIIENMEMIAYKKWIYNIPYEIENIMNEMEIRKELKWNKKYEASFNKYGYADKDFHNFDVKIEYINEKIYIAILYLYGTDEPSCNII